MVDLFGEEILEIPYYLPAPVRARRDEGARVAHGLHVRARLRDLPLRGEQERRQALGRGARGGQAPRPRGDRPVPHPPHRGRHPRPRLRHVVRHEPRTRSAWATTGWSTSSRARLHRQGGPPPDQGRGAEAPAGRRRDRRAQSRVVQRRLDDRRLPGAHGGSRIGEVTSACWSPRLEKNIGYAMVPTEHSELGTSSRSSARETRRRGRREKPFVDPEKETPKQELTAAAGWGRIVLTFRT